MAERRRIATRLAGGAAAAALLFVLLVSATQGGPGWFVHFGQREFTIAPYGHEILGDDLITPTRQGTDGQYFWLQARDPFITDTAVVQRWDDRPVYRSQRVLYPLAAAPWRAFGEQAMLWALVLLNVAAVGAGTYWATLLALQVGAPARAGLAMVLNPGVITALVLDGSDVAALALSLGGMLAWERRRPGWAALAFTGAALTKEVVLLIPAALFLAWFARERRAALTMAVPPAVAVALWAVYVRIRLGTDSQVEEFAVPLYGYVDAWRRTWLPFHDWANMLCAIAIGVAAIAVVVLWWRDRRSTLLLGALPFAGLFLVLSAQVINLPTNSLRAAAPMLTFLAIAAYARVAPEPARPAPSPAIV